MISQIAGKSPFQMPHQTPHGINLDASIKEKGFASISNERGLEVHRYTIIFLAYLEI